MNQPQVFLGISIIHLNIKTNFLIQAHFYHLDSSGSTVLAWFVVDRGFKRRPESDHDLNIESNCYFAKYSAFRTETNGVRRKRPSKPTPRITADVERKRSFPVYCPQHTANVTICYT